MTLIILNFLLFSTLWIDTISKESKCPTGWAKGKQKCFKYIPQRFELRQAVRECSKIGGKIFRPKDEKEFKGRADL